MFNDMWNSTMILYIDQSYKKIVKEPERSKHIMIRDIMQDGVMKLQYISTNEYVVDVLTKSLPKGKP